MNSRPLLPSQIPVAVKDLIYESFDYLESGLPKCVGLYALAVNHGADWHGLALEIEARAKTAGGGKLPRRLADLVRVVTVEFPLLAGKWKLQTQGVNGWGDVKVAVEGSTDYTVDLFDSYEAAADELAQFPDSGDGSYRVVPASILADCDLY